ncbi:MAG: phosphoribosyltransferase family protein [Dehalococcoidales bacterium]|nr:phosphoribosyltransferase family protein [Dehalococcoidales bacterium]
MTAEDKVKILSHSGAPFETREEAGRLLGQAFLEYRSQKAVVLGVPRGGVVVAQALAQVLKADLDIVLAHKLRTPGYGELAMGAVGERGDLFLNEEVVRDLRVDGHYIRQEKEIQLAEIQRRAKLFRAVHNRIPLKGRVVIVTDDGVATGATTQAAVWAVRQENPKKLILAVPVGAEETLRKLAVDSDELICLRAPYSLMAVGQFYIHFEPVTDEEILAILKNYRIK